MDSQPTSPPQIGSRQPLGRQRSERPATPQPHDVRRPSWFERRFSLYDITLAALIALIIALTDLTALFASAVLFGWFANDSLSDGVALARGYVLPYGSAILIPVFLLQGLYGRKSITAWAQILRAYGTFLLAAGLTIHFANLHVRSLVPVFMLALATCVGIAAFRSIVGHLVALWNSATNVAVFGTRENLEILASRFENRRNIYDVRHVGDTRDPDEIERLVRESQAKLVGLDAFVFGHDAIMEMQRRLAGQNVHIVALAPLTDGTSSRPLPHEIQYVLKRILDIAGASVLVVCMVPVMLLLTLLVKVTSPGPALYRSPRMGLGGRTFECLKFRTMYTDAEHRQEDLELLNEAQGPLFKMEQDPRVTPLGRWLRGSSLDELPQLINVLRGEMSLVGPRPLPLRDCDLLTEEDQRRHSVLPGITGRWQVAPNRHDEADIVALDLEYVDNWSLAADVRILLKTFLVVLQGLPSRRVTPE